MKKLRMICGALFFASVVLMSCAGDGGWPEYEKNAFIENCVSPEAEVTEDYCNCMLKKIMNKYPNPEDAANLDYEWMMEVAEDCID